MSLEVAHKYIDCKIIAHIIDITNCVSKQLAFRKDDKPNIISSNTVAFVFVLVNQRLHKNVTGSIKEDNLTTIINSLLVEINNKHREQSIKYRPSIRHDFVPVVCPPAFIRVIIRCRDPSSLPPWDRFGVVVSDFTIPVGNHRRRISASSTHADSHPRSSHVRNRVAPIATVAE